MTTSKRVAKISATELRDPKTPKKYLPSLGSDLEGARKPTAKPKSQKKK